MREEILSTDYKGNTGTGKALAVQYWQPELSWNPGKVKRENWCCRVVLWCPHGCHDNNGDDDNDDNHYHHHPPDYPNLRLNARFFFKHTEMLHHGIIKVSFLGFCIYQLLETIGNIETIRARFTDKQYAYVCSFVTLLWKVMISQFKLFELTFKKFCLVSGPKVQ